MGPSEFWGTSLLEFNGTSRGRHCQAFPGIGVPTNVCNIYITTMYRTSIRNIQKIVNLKFFSDFGQYNITFW